MLANPIKWPNGACCAVAITFDMDSDSILYSDHSDRASTMVGTASWLRYDRVAVPRILRLYEKYDIKQTFFVPGWTAEQYREVVREIVSEGHEVALHGYFHEKPNTLDPEIEKYWFDKSVEAITEVTGKRPVGFRAPSYRFSKHTLKNLLDAGVLYDSSLMSDDLPYLLVDRDSRRTLIELPTDWSRDDWPQFTNNSELGYRMPIKSPKAAMEVFIAEFDAAWTHGGLWISVWHPFVFGRLSRLMAVDDMIHYMKSKGSVWFATLEEIATYARQQVDEGVYKPYQDLLPFHA
jgi:peptidoglycan/xylan/chitin deacetylase (PgdA/CDA1 family)